MELGGPALLQQRLHEHPQQQKLQQKAVASISQG